MNITQKIISLLKEAQNASDEAKRFYFNKTHYYCIKSKCIKKAIMLLKHNKNNKIQYRIERGVDQNGYKSIIFYFEFYIKGEKKQFSFHSPERNGWFPEEGNKSIRWNGRIGACQQLAADLEKHKNK